MLDSKDKLISLPNASVLQHSVMEELNIQLIISKSFGQPFLSLRQTERFSRLETVIESELVMDEDTNGLNRSFRYELHPEEALTLSYGIFN